MFVDKYISKFSNLLGDPDPEEQKVYESSPSTGSVSSFTKPRRVSRSASMASDITEKPPSETSPKKRKPAARSHTESPTKSSKIHLKLHIIISSLLLFPFSRFFLFPKTFPLTILQTFHSLLQPIIFSHFSFPLFCQHS